MYRFNGKLDTVEEKAIVNYNLGYRKICKSKHAKAIRS